MIQRALINFDRKTKSFAWLLDPDQYHPAQAPRIAALAEELKIDFLFVGGSLVFHISDELIREIKKITRIPVILFPGSVNQVSNEADAILMLSLISGRNPEYLIGNHVIAAPFIRASDLEVIPTGYMLVDGGHPSAVQYMSNTVPIPHDKTDLAVATAMAGEMLGLKVIFMDGGSGAQIPVASDMIKGVHEAVDIPLIVGGGLRTPNDADRAYRAGADVIVVGNAVEEEPDKLRDIIAVRDQINT